MICSSRPSLVSACTGGSAFKSSALSAGNISGYVLGFGIFAGLWHYYFLADGNMLFHIAVASLIASQVAEYALTILFYRRGV